MRLSPSFLPRRYIAFSDHAIRSKRNVEGGIMMCTKQRAILLATLLALPMTGCDLIMESCTSELTFAAEPPSATLKVGETVQLRGRAWGCGGKDRLPVDVDWTTADSAVIHVSPEGEVRGLKPGTATARGVDSGRYGAGPFIVSISVTE